MMKRFIDPLLIISLCLSPVVITLTPQPSWAQRESIETTIQQLTEQATTQTQQRHSQKAIDTWQEILELAQQYDKKALQAFALVGLGLNYYDLKQPTKALEYYQEALPIAQQVGDRRVVGATLNNIGAAYQSLGQYQQALNYYKRALPITQEVAQLADIAKNLNNIGEIHSLNGENSNALQYYQEALFIAQKSGDPILEQEIRNNIAEIGNEVKNYQGIKFRLNVKKSCNLPKVLLRL